MLILSVANIQRLTLARMLESAGIPATVLSSLGTAAPWPVESGATALIYGESYFAVAQFAARLCRDRGESCAMLVEIPGASASFIPATPES